MLYLMVSPLLGKERKRLEANIHRVYGLPAHSNFAKMFAQQVFTTQFKNALLTLRYIFAPRSVTVVGYEAFEKYLDQQSEGVVVITAHIGLWELAGHFCAKALPRRLHVLAKPNRITWTTSLLTWLRKKLQMNVLWTDSKSLLKDMIRTLKKGEGLGFVMDQRPAKRDGGHKVSFLGVPDTPIVTGPATMIAKSGVPVYGAYCLSEGKGRLRLVIREILAQNHGVTDELEISRLLAHDMELVIRTYPEQWAWNYKRWSMTQHKV